MRVFLMLANALVEAIRHPFRACLFATVLYILFFVVLSVAGSVLFFVMDAASYAIHDPIHDGPAVLLLLGIIGVVVLVVWRWCRVHLPQWRPRARGARWATRKELRREGFLAPQGWPLGWRPGFWGRQVLRLPAKRELEGVLVVAQTGTGKTGGELIPTILAEADRPAPDRRSLILVDPKDELAPLTRGVLAESHRVLVWDPTNPAECTIRYDPLSLLPSPTDPSFVEEVRHLADAWCDTTREGDYHNTDPIWPALARHYMRAVILTYFDGTTPTDRSFTGLGDWVRRLTHDALLVFVEYHIPAFAQTMRSVGMNERMAGSVFSDLQHRFEILDAPNIRAAMQPGQTIDWEAFIKEPTALFLKVPTRDAKQLGALLSLFMAQAYRALTGIASRYPRNVLPRGVGVIVDELGTIARIHNLEVALATMRSYGIGHLLAVQSRSQLAMIYGTKLAQNITDNLVTNIVLGGASPEDSRWMSNLCGQRTTYQRRTTHSAGGFARGMGASFGYEADSRPLIAPEEISHLTGAVYVSTHGLPPLRCRLQPYYKNRATVRRMEAAARQWSASHPSQPTAGGPAPALAPPPPPPAASGSPPPTPPPWSVPNAPADRDTPPPGCTETEWTAAPWSIQETRFSMEDDVAALASGKAADLDALRATWQRSWPKCSPARYRRVTPAEASEAPKVWQYVDELARRLELR